MKTIFNGRTPKETAADIRHRLGVNKDADLLPEGANVQTLVAVAAWFWTTTNVTKGEFDEFLKELGLVWQATPQGSQVIVPKQ